MHNEVELYMVRGDGTYFKGWNWFHRIFYRRHLWHGTYSRWQAKKLPRAQAMRLKVRLSRLFPDGKFELVLANV